MCVLEKASAVGAHALSGAVMEPGPLDELAPDWRDSKPDICVPATRDEFLLYTRKSALRLPTPPQMSNHGNFIVSLGQITPWLAAKAEASRRRRVRGVRRGPAAVRRRGASPACRSATWALQKDGTPGPGYTPGPEIRARITLVAEGCRGSLAKVLMAKYGLCENRSPQTFALGLKELWQLPPGRVQPGLIQHSFGWPLDTRTYGGSFVYHLDRERIYVGFVVGLDYEDPRFKPFESFQQFKHHPRLKALLEGGEILAAGARSIAAGGWQSMPKLEMPGALLLGDAGGTVNLPKIKGIHQAIRSGMLAAQHLAETDGTAGFDARWRASAGGRELRKVRNFKPGFKRGLWFGLANSALETVTVGKLPWTMKNDPNWSAMKKLDEYESPDRGWVERTLPPRDRLASVFFAATAHDEHQPAHLKVHDTTICATRCRVEYGNPCQNFCPANVYEMVDDGAGGKRLQINAANCVHCKACDIKDPYEIITWTTPEGGSGPNYQGL